MAGLQLRALEQLLQRKENNMLLMFVIFEIVSLSIMVVMMVEDALYDIFPDCCHSDVEDKELILFIAAFLGGWCLVWYYVYLAVKAVKSRCKNI